MTWGDYIITLHNHWEKIKESGARIEGIITFFSLLNFIGFNEKQAWQLFKICHFHKFHLKTSPEEIPSVDFKKLRFPLPEEHQSLIKNFIKHKGYKSTDNHFQLIKLTGKTWELVEKILKNDINWPSSVPEKKRVAPTSVSSFKLFQSSYASEEDKIEFLQKVSYLDE